MLFRSGCSETQKVKEDLSKSSIEVSYVDVPQIEGKTNYVATLKIEGMTCAMGCAKSIEGKLNGIEGVVLASVDFEKGQADVEFDNNSTEVDNFIQKINNLHDGQYVVTEASVAKPIINNLEIDVPKNNKDSEVSSDRIDLIIPSFQLPNVLDVLFKIILP